ncbi:MAG: small subunit ribosomal protein, partial [Solirubrobacteraceae bacterium]|nr:small subunit ribosomal protein [Solirubrobacteraceae bacterium]
PWQRVVDTYNVGDELEGTVTKVVTFGAFVEILDGVEGLVHISELAPHHVENPREIVSPGDDVKVKILEIDSERRRLSLSVKRVEGQVLTPKVLPPEELEGAGDLDDLPELGLSEEVFAGGAGELAEASADAPAVDDAPTADEAADAPVADAEVAEPADETPADDGADAPVAAAEDTDAEPAPEPAVDDAPTADEAAGAPVADAEVAEPASADDPA